MASSKGTPEEEMMVAIFGINRRNPWDPRFPLFYPYAIIWEEGEEKKLGLAEAIQGVINTLPSLARGINDPRAWDGYKQVLELRFGLKDGRPRTLKETGQ